MTDTDADSATVNIVPAAATGMRLVVTRPVYFLWPIVFALAVFFAGPLAVQAIGKATAPAPGAAGPAAAGAPSGTGDAAEDADADAAAEDGEAAEADAAQEAGEDSDAPDEASADAEDEAQPAEGGDSDAEDSEASVDEDEAAAEDAADAAPVNMWRFGACKAQKASAKGAANATAPGGGPQRGGPQRGGGPGGPGGGPQGPPSPAAQGAQLLLTMVTLVYVLSLQGAMFRLVAGRVEGSPVFPLRFGFDELRLLAVNVLIPLALGAVFLPFAALAFVSGFAPGPCGFVEPLAIVAYVAGGLTAAFFLCRFALFGPAVVAERRFAFRSAWATSGKRLDAIIAGTLAGLITPAILVLVPGNLIVLGLTFLLSTGGQTPPQAFLGALGQLVMTTFIFLALLSLLGMVAYVYVKSTTGREPTALNLHEPKDSAP